MLPVLALSDTRPHVTLAVPGSSSANSGAINRFTLRFSEAMVPLGDPRATAPATIKCAVSATSRWADQQTFIFEFERALPGGLKCSVDLRRDLKTERGISIGDSQKFTIDTGGPTARAILTSGLYGPIDEDQTFLIAANVKPDARTVSSYGYCTVDGVGEKIALDVLPAKTVSDVVKGLGGDNWRLRNFLEEAGLPSNLGAAEGDISESLSTVVAAKCRRPLVPGKSMSLVWDKQIADAAGNKAGRDQRFDYRVREAFTAKFQCPRVNASAGCNPVQDVRVRFTAPVPRDQALAARLTIADGAVIKPEISDSNKGDAQLSSVTFKGRFPGATDASISLPKKTRGSKWQDIG